MATRFSDHSTTQLPDGTRMYWGTATMGIPEGGKHVRQVSVFLPPMSRRNAVTTTLYSTESVGQGFVVFNMKKVYEKDFTQFAISAQNMDKGEPQDWEYLLDFMVIERPEGK